MVRTGADSHKCKRQHRYNQNSTGTSSNDTPVCSSSLEAVVSGIDATAVTQPTQPNDQSFAANALLTLSHSPCSPSSSSRGLSELKHVVNHVMGDSPDFEASQVLVNNVSCGTPSPFKPSKSLSVRHEVAQSNCE